MILPILAGIVVRAAVQYAAKKAVQYGGKKLAKAALKKLMERARRYGARMLKKEIQRRKNCKSCKSLDKLKDPCKFLKKGNPAGSGKYRGGGYSGVPGSKARGLESHHAPANKSYPRGSGLSTGQMPAIQMDRADHLQTSSYGNSATAKAYRSAQTAALKSGGVLAAFAMDVADIKLRFGDKYDSALMEAGAYAACLEYFKDKYRPAGGRRK